MVISIASVSGSKSLTSFTDRFFHFSKPPGFRMAFDAAERNERFGRIQFQRSKREQQQRKEKETSISLQRDNEKQSHLSKLSKN